MTTTAETIASEQSTATSHPDPRQLLARGIAVATSVIGDVRADQMRSPTPCHDLDVSGVQSHLVGVLYRAAAIGRGEDAMSVPGTFDCDDSGWEAAWATAAHAVEQAWLDDAALARIVVLPWATLPGGAALLGYLNEVVVHTWDLAQATGQHPTWDDDVVAAAYSAISSMLPAEGRAEMFKRIMEAIDPDSLPDGFEGHPFGEAVAVADTASPIDRLVGYTGRVPAPT